VPRGIRRDPRRREERDRIAVNRLAHQVSMPLRNETGPAHHASTPRAGQQRRQLRTVVRARRRLGGESEGPAAAGAPCQSHRERGPADGHGAERTGPPVGHGEADARLSPPSLQPF
jgi:hypothetical protein